MISFNRKFYCFNIKETWFGFDFSMKDLFSLKTFANIECKSKKLSFCINEIKSTTVINLNKKKEEIINKFDATVKRDIRKAELFEINCCFYEDKNLFISFFNEFAKLKGIYQPKKITIDSFGNNYITSFAFHQGNLIAAHSYIIDKDSGVAILFQSASKRLDKKFDKSIVGYANKLLTYHDIFHFKNNGFRKYDFGGFALNTENKSLLGINRFKLSFGAEIIKYYVYHTPLLYFLIKVSRYLDRRYR